MPPNSIQSLGRLLLADSLPWDIGLGPFSQNQSETTPALTTFSTHTIHEHSCDSCHPTHAADRATLSGSKEQLDLSKAQLLVAILTLVGIGKLIEILIKKGWKAIRAYILDS